MGERTEEVLYLELSRLNNELVTSQRDLAQRNAELARRERDLRGIYASLADGIVIFTPEGVIELINRAAERIFGYPEGKLLGQSISVLIPDHLRPTDAAGTRKFLETGEPSLPAMRDRCWPALRHDGSIIDVEFSIAELQRDSGPRLVAVVRDVSQRAALERMKGEFISTVSHELRTPLTSINGSMGLLAGGVAGELPPAARKLVDIASQNCARLIRLVNDILDLEKMDSGRMVFDPSEVEAGELLKDVVAATEGYARVYGVSLKLDVHEPVQLFLDSQRLHQAVTNFVSNAVKYSPRDQPVEISLTRRAGFARIEVRDHGPGIPEEFRSRIFGKFSQAEGVDHRKKSGTGLGLCISKGIAERMGGTVGYETQVGFGTTFFIEVPAQAAPTQALTQ